MFQKKNQEEKEDQEKHWIQKLMHKVQFIYVNGLWTCMRLSKKRLKRNVKECKSFDVLCFIRECSFWRLVKYKITRRLKTFAKINSTWAWMKKKRFNNTILSFFLSTICEGVCSIDQSGNVNLRIRLRDSVTNLNTTVQLRLYSSPFKQNLSFILSFTPGPPGAPGGVRVMNKTEKSVTLQWSRGADNHSPISKYTIQYRDSFSEDVWKTATTCEWLQCTSWSNKHCTLMLS